MHVFLVLFAISQFGHTLSVEAICSVKDIQICETCKNVQCQPDRNNTIGSFTDVSSSDECQDWCRRRHDYMDDCQYLTYFGKQGHPFKNTCYIFNSCQEKTECKDCVTETFDCFCSSSIMPNMEGTKPLHRFDGINSEGECRQKCRHNNKCTHYTYIADSHKCFLLSQLIEPFHDCSGCKTGKANCTEAPMTSTSTTSTTPSTITTTTPTTTTITTTTKLVTTATTMPPGWCDSDSKCKWEETCVDHFCQNVCVPAPCTHPHEVCTVSWLTKHKAVCYCDSGWIREPTGECGRPTEPTTISTTTSTTTKKTTAPTKPPGWCDWDSDCNWDEVCQNHICKCMNGWVREPTGACFPISTK